MFKTAVAAEKLGVKSYRLLNLVRIGKVPKPAKDSSGDYVWSESDLERARNAIAEQDGRRKRSTTEPQAA